MSTTAESGPFGTFGQAVNFESNPEIGPSFWAFGDMLLDPRAPFTYQPGQKGSQPNFGWPTIGAIPIIDQIPSAASTTNIVDAATPTPGTPLTLVSSSGSGVTVSCSLTSAATGLSVTGLLGLDVAAARTFTGTFTNGSPKITFTSANAIGIQAGDQITLTTSGTLPTPFATSTTYYVAAIVFAVPTASSSSGALMLAAAPGGAPISATSAGSGTQTVNVTAPGSYNTSYTPFAPPVVFGPGGSGTGGPIRFWNPNWMLSRTLILTNNASDTSGTYVVAGYDVYGYPMTQTLTGPNNSTVSTTKAFKYITSITPQGTINSTSVSVGTNDDFGLPLRTDHPLFLTAYWNNAAILAGTTGSSTFTVPDITTSSSTTGDVRGLFYGGSASDGTKRLIVYWNPQAGNISGGIGAGTSFANSFVGLLGQPQS